MLSFVASLIARMRCEEVAHILGLWGRQRRRRTTSARCERGRQRMRILNEPPATHRMLVLLDIDDTLIDHSAAVRAGVAAQTVGSHLSDAQADELFDIYFRVYESRWS